ncbi:Syh1p [Saccharomyces eubayanus]|uniref:Syh1p n=1 Tax=Saccharomyces eubayanus TaxID=1080349 RepID=UPI0006BFE6FB|nr:SYH1-like protein [Saccharomyces eubayanus]KOG96209.1 SYH1-like protein [Saccharomyces eubayanus]
MNPLNSLVFDLQSIKLADANSDTTTLSNSNTPMMNNTAPLQRTSSLLDSIGIQRGSSPFVPASVNAVNGAGAVPMNAYGAEIAGSGPQIPVNQDNSGAFNVASNLHVSTSSASLNNNQPNALPNMGSYLFNSAGLASNAGNQLPPPGIESQWKYVDSNGNIQGPFSSNNMSQWYQAGYFTPTLQICRLATSIEPFGVSDQFITLGKLTTLVNNYQDPFTTFDFIAITALSGVPSVTPIAPENQKVETKKLKPTADVHSDDFTYEEILNLKFEDGSYYRETQVWVPVNGRHVTKVDHIPESIKKSAPTAGVEKRARSNEPKSAPTKASAEEYKVETASDENELPQEAQNADEKTILQDSILSKVQEVEQISPENRELENTSQISSEEQKRFAKAELMAQKLLEEQQRQEEEKKRREEQRNLKKEKKLKQKQKKEEDKLKKKKKEDGKLEKEKQKELLNSILSEDTESSSPTESPVASSGTNLAPWANKQADDAVSNQISSALEDLKKKNTLKKEKKPSRTQLDREEALKLQKEILGSTQAQTTAHTASAWGIKPQQQPIKLDIKEELLKGSKSAKGLPTVNKKKMSKDDDFQSNSTFIEEQKKLWEQVQKKSKKSNRITSLDDFISRTPSPLSSAANSSNPSNAWTTVSSKSTTTSTTSAAPVSVNQPRSYISPDKLRSVGGTASTIKTKANGKGKQIGSSTSIPNLKARQAKVSRAPAYPGNASVSKRQEFLKWCRSQLKLNSGVQPDNVLEMLLSLPPGPESKEIIADTIYSYSSTMDGRRFATDFTKKRLECEEQISDPLSWSEVLTMPEGSSEDWEFQVVGKKKGRRF